MKTRNVATDPKGRLKKGAAILAAAPLVDTQLVKPRLTAYERAYGSYADIHSNVVAAEAQLREEQVRLPLRDAEQDAALETLARALVAGGHPRLNPFAEFGTETPSLIKKMPFAAAAKAIQALVAAVQRNKKVNKAALQAAQAAEEAAQVVEAALGTVATAEDTVRTLRRTRDEAGKTLDRALKALKRGANAAADDGAPGLYAALFGSQRRKATKKGTAKPAPVETPPAASEPKP